MDPRETTLDSAFHHVSPLIPQAEFKLKIVCRLIGGLIRVLDSFEVSRFRGSGVKSFRLWVQGLVSSLESGSYIIPG